MSPRSEPGPDRVEQTGDGDRSGPARRTVLLSAAGLTVLGGLAWLPDPRRTGLPSLAGEPTVPTAALASRRAPRFSAARVSALQASTHRASPARAVAHPVTVRDSRSGRAVHPGVEQSIAATGRELVLSIDDGPSPDYTPEVLAILRRYDVKATFCMVGRNVAAYPEVAKAVTADGHQLANHTWSHAWLPDGGGDRSHTVTAIRTYLPRLLRLGYRFALP
jgi:hypothetical protein